MMRQAARSLGASQFLAYQPVTQDATRAVPLEGMLTFLPEIEGVQFDPARLSFRWVRAVHKEVFHLRAESRLAGKTARGRLSVFLGAILLADVVLTIRVDPEARLPGEDDVQDRDDARPYRKIFASYSHKDEPIVQQFEHFARALGDNYLRDWRDLRSGQVWNERLKALIKEADVFQLFWSRNAMHSEYVREEYCYALGLQREGLKRASFVRPIYWEVPLPSDKANNLPPAELLELHFQRIEGCLLPGVSPERRDKGERTYERALPRATMPSPSARGGKRVGWLVRAALIAVAVGGLLAGLILGLRWWGTPGVPTPPRHAQTHRGAEPAEPRK
jgi:hypothetical protein